ncbi:MAG: hypothetical protein QF767_08525, partial [Alphaproteobacteria bacterium]|nr:hypothetical protein [Alphaproteobacteria bacterium]
TWRKTCSGFQKHPAANVAFSLMAPFLPFPLLTPGRFIANPLAAGKAAIAKFPRLAARHETPARS